MNLKRRRNLEKEGLPSGAVEIYDRVLAVEYKKRPNECFRSEFGRGSKVYGLPDGSILIRSQKGKRLWEEFDYD